jgi:hypothetical protein
VLVVISIEGSTLGQLSLVNEASVRWVSWSQSPASMDLCRVMDLHVQGDCIAPFPEVQARGFELWIDYVRIVDAHFGYNIAVLK